MVTATVGLQRSQFAAGDLGDIDWTLILPDGYRTPLTDDDWNHLVSFWARIEQPGQTSGAAVSESPGMVLALRELMLDVIGIRGEHVEEVFSRRYGADLLDCVKSQLWFSDVVKRLSCLPLNDINALRTGSLKNISIRRKDRIAEWQARAKTLTSQYFGHFVGKRWAISTGYPLLQRLRDLSGFIDFEDLEVLLHTSLPLSGDPALRLSIETLVRTSLGLRFGEWLRPDPWACLWRYCEGANKSH